MGKVKVKKDSFNVDGVEIPTAKGLKEYLKNHELLQHCTTEKLYNENGTGKLVWARNPGSVFWPALIATLVDKPGYDPDANEPDILTQNDYRCIMFLETTFRYSVLGWKDLVLVDENRIDEQSCLIAKYNRFLRRSWREDKSYKEAVSLLLQFKDIPILQRQDRGFQLSLERKLIKNAEKAVRTPKPVMENESSNYKRDNTLKYWEQRSAEDREYLGRQLGPNAFNMSTRSECPGRAKETVDNNTGDECSRSSIDSGDNGFKPERSLPNSRSDTPNASSMSGGSEVETLSDISRRAKKRPKVGGAPMKTFTEERFISVDKGYKFDMKTKKEVWRCASCLKEIVTGQQVMCHELPHHQECLLETDSISKDGSAATVYKCHMCKEGQCFICKIVTKELNCELERATKCSKCDLRFHRSCLQAWPQAELQGSVGSIICPVHFCHTCLGEQKVYNRMRNYKAFSGSGGGKYRCLQCLTTYHKPCCLPAGTGDDITGKDFITCPKHTIPKIKTTQRRFGCLSCGIYMKATSTNRVECSLCLQIFHPECVGYTDIEANRGLKLSDFAKDYKCMSCLWGLLPLYGQVVWYQQTGHSFWPARILYPREAIGRTEYVQNRSIGEYSIKYFGPQPSYYDKASRTFPLHLTTVKLFTAMKIYKETDKIKSAYEEATFFHQHVEDLRDTRLMAPEPYYKKIERNIYRHTQVNMTKKKQESIGSCCCNCYKSNGDVCTSNSGCHNRDTSVECNDKNCRAGYRCENRMFTMKRKDTENTEQFLSPSKGWAVKAARDFKEGEFIIEYCGEIINNVEMQYRANRKSEEDPLYLLEIDKNTFIDAEYYGNVSRLINHSCEPNCRTEKYTSVNRSVVGVFAHRDIDKGEELTFDYAYGDQSAAPFRCYCGMPTCRTYIGKSFTGDSKGDVVNFDLEKYDKTCAKCSFGGYVLCCDFEGCYKVYHKTCAQITREPENEWYCPNHSKAELKTAAKQKAVKTPGSKLIYKSNPPQQPSEVKGTAEAISTSTNIQKRAKSDKFLKSRKIVSVAKNPLARRSLPAKMIGGVTVAALAGKKKKDNDNGMKVGESRNGGEIKAVITITNKRSSTSVAPSTPKNTITVTSPSYQNNPSIPDLINIWTGTASSNLKNIMPVSSRGKFINNVTVPPRSKLKTITGGISPPRNSSFTKTPSKSAHIAKNAVKTVESTSTMISNVSNSMKRRSSRVNSTPPVETSSVSNKRSSKQITNADEAPASKRSCSRRRLSTPSSKENFSVLSESRSEETTKESPSNGSVGNEKVTDWLTKSESQKSSDDRVDTKRRTRRSESLLN